MLKGAAKVKKSPTTVGDFFQTVKKAFNGIDESFRLFGRLILYGGERFYLIDIRRPDGQQYQIITQCQKHEKAGKHNGQLYDVGQEAQLKNIEGSIQMENWIKHTKVSGIEEQ